jgi:hypothetical protein
MMANVRTFELNRALRTPLGHGEHRQGEPEMNAGGLYQDRQFQVSINLR